MEHRLTTIGKYYDYAIAYSVMKLVSGLYEMICSGYDTEKATPE